MGRPLRLFRRPGRAPVGSGLEPVLADPGGREHAVRDALSLTLRTSQIYRHPWGRAQRGTRGPSSESCLKLGALALPSHAALTWGAAGSSGLRASGAPLRGWRAFGEVRGGPKPAFLPAA